MANRIVVLRGQPGHVIYSRPIALPQPKSRGKAETAAMSEEIASAP
jgi:ABC-type nitrate/sulfonate/bicarbonate transport system ATPase subunit